MSVSAIPRIRLGISSCLLGEAVRFDSGHARDSFLADAFGRYVEWVSVCPEVEMGLGAPRETIRLVERGGETRLVAPASGSDHTRAMSKWAAARLRHWRKKGSMDTFSREALRVAAWRECACTTRTGR